MKNLCLVLLLIPLTSIACPDFISGKYQCTLISGDKKTFERQLSDDIFDIKRIDSDTYKIFLSLYSDGDHSNISIDKNTIGKVTFQCSDKNNSIAWVATHPDGSVITSFNFYPIAGKPSFKAKNSVFTSNSKLGAPFIAQCDLVGEASSNHNQKKAVPPAKVQKIIKDEITDYFTTSIDSVSFFETGDDNDRTRYLDYLISRYIVNTLGVNERLETKAFWDLKLSTPSYRGSQLASNVETIFAQADQFKNDCRKELKRFKQSSSYQLNKKKPEFNKFLGSLLNNWFMSRDSISEYRVNMELYFDFNNDRVPLASCPVWKGLYKKALSKIKAGSEVRDYDGVLPSCGVFRQLKQCTLDFYQALQKRDPNSPKNRVMEYSKTGIWLL